MDANLKQEHMEPSFFFLSPIAIDWCRSDGELHFQSYSKIEAELMCSQSGYCYLSLKEFGA